jgi:hypothetical protein
VSAEKGLLRAGAAQIKVVCAHSPAGSSAPGGSTNTSNQENTGTGNTGSVGNTDTNIGNTGNTGNTGPINNASDNDFPLCQETDVDWSTAAAALINAPSDPADASQATDQLSQDLLTLAVQAIAANSPDAQTFASGGSFFKSDSILLASNGTVASDSGGTIPAVRSALTKDCGLRSAAGLPEGTASNPGSTTTTTTTPSTPSGATASNGPLATLESYWASIGAHHFGVAYGLLVAGSVGLTESQFVSGEQRADIQSVQFRGHVASRAGAVATVGVDSLVTHDAQFGCRSWTGSYQVTDQGGAWLIERASITPTSCG